MIQLMPMRLHIHPEVQQAQLAQTPLVALESTVISHGLPWPENLQLASRLQDIVRANGAVPATIGLLEGRIHIGLSDEQLTRLAQPSVAQKVSRRDIPLVLANAGWGATTVAATMFCAALAGIRVFATGGIGGVHRGGQDSLDVSADLMELARSNVAVVCAGAKGILDIGRTLEVLETHGVPVIGYQTLQFPAFWCTHSGHSLVYQAQDASQVARICRIKWNLGLSGGVLVANPPPHESALDRDYVENNLQQAFADAHEQGVSGSQLTPFLLKRMTELTRGDSLRTNVALLEHNAALAAAIACEWEQIEEEPIRTDMV